MRSKRIMANSFSVMESRVMPRWFEHTSLFPLFFQKGIMIPLRQSSVMVFLHGPRVILATAKNEFLTIYYQFR